MTSDIAVAAIWKADATYVANTFLDHVRTHELRPDQDASDVQVLEGEQARDGDVCCFEGNDWGIATGRASDARWFADATAAAADAIDGIGLVGTSDANGWRLAVYRGATVVARHAGGDSEEPALLARLFGVPASVLSAQLRDPRPDALWALLQAIGAPRPTTTPPALLRWASSRQLGIDLAFVPDASPAHWKQLLEVLWTWEPALRPRTLAFTRRDRDLPELIEEPWSTARHDELATTLADSAGGLVWNLVGERDDYAIQCAAHRGWVELSLRVPVTVDQQPTRDRFLLLLEVLPATTWPVSARVADFFALEEHAHDTVAPVTYVDPRMIERLGGRDRVRTAPCEVREAPGNGLLLIVRADPFADIDATSAAVAAHLGITEDTPLSLAPWS